MREIKFRAWDNKNKKLVSFENIELPYSENVNLDGQIEGILDRGIILMQYTGLKDKNDVEIYEGDIVGHNGFIGYVKYINSGNCNVLGYALVSLINGRIFYMFCDETDNYEVIGNIYENKELLA